MAGQKCNYQAADIVEDFSVEDFDDFEEDCIDYVFIPNDNEDESSNSYCNLDSDSDEEYDGSYEFFYEKYNSSQKLLHEKHPYEWIDGEAKYDNPPEELIFLTEDQKQKIKNMSYVEVFELFFSNDLKDYIIECTKENDHELSRDKFDRFMGILVTSNFNIRKSDRHFWSTNDLLHHNRVSLVMPKNIYLSIKRYKIFKRM